MEPNSNNTTKLFYPEASFMVESPESKIMKAVAISIVGLVAVVGNCLVMAAVFQSTKLQTVTNYLIVNMAVSDLLYIIIALPPFYFDLFELYEWTFSTHINRVYFCKIVHFGQYSLPTVSVLTLATIAVDRFFAIAIPLRRIFTKKAFYIIATAIWLIGAAVASPMFYAQKIKYDDMSGHYYCDEDWSPAFEDTRLASRIYTLLLFSVVYCVPFMAMTIMYTIICKKLWKRKIPGEQNETNNKTLTESRKKVVKMLIVVLIAFIVCWLPIQIISFVWEYAGVDIPLVVYFICGFLIRTHASLSPCIYAIFSANYRAGFKKALCYCCVKKNDQLIRNDTCSRRPTSYHHIDSRRNNNGRKDTLVILKTREKMLAKFDD
ncbi:RYamide receptor-like isoform X1 [Exaiptasia diaphana]|uniref:G-protein coupled receptors family 1 profile domain-containing protein n=1 Tax=Exaiptasia diaphana TaxID=2652724 RepID=A0A913XD35_EXADI|nr:RYamide receptor-like isoform X1 [Exaiptasia diaphana]XP_020902805.1 RYamide receptor-like isoform X1 [Exaiptasia diaphana]XP_020902807.1 RYamide receptor-like isoform X1 [Exaiptasia diaphana]